ncbi:MAG: hypothetical protein ABWK53_11465 [Anaerolineales bacterium]
MNTFLPPDAEDFPPLKEEDIRPPRRYLGMTIKQLVVVGGLALLACILMAVLGYLILRNLTAGPVSPVSSGLPTEMPSPTFTASPLPSATPTATATPIPYESVLPPGWKQLRYLTVELWVPPSFVGGGMFDERDATVAAIDALGPDFSAVTRSLDRYPPTTVLLAVDSNLGRYFIITNLIVFFEPLPFSNLDAYPDYYLTTYYQSGTATPFMQENRRYAIRDLPARRFIITLRQGTIEVAETVYIIQDGETIWALSCVTSAAELYERLPVFDQIAQTLRLAP